MDIRHIKIWLIFLLFFLLFGRLQAQQTMKVVAECSITYTVTSEGSKNGQTIKKLFIKGRKTRSEISNPSFYQATIFDNKTGDAVILKEVGGDKYLSSFTAEQWKEKNSEWDSSIIKITGETKKILTYNCRKAIITTKDSSTFEVYFTTEMNASANENPYQFKNIQGLVLEYESRNKKGNNIEFNATDISFNPVPAARFFVPATGYRVIQ